MSRNPIIVALDLGTLDEATTLARTLGDAIGAVKVGLELFGAHGPDAVRAFDAHEVFLDLKLHDIPTTVARTVVALRPLEASLLTLHATGGRAMLEAANAEKGSTKTLGVTILTSLSDDDLAEIGLPKSRDAVPMLATLARDAGCDGVVCAPNDVSAVRAACPAPFLIVTPGVRPSGASRDDQARTMTPRDAVDAGSDRLVIGRPITRAADPRAAAQAILQELR